jgi:hypothetical protein
VIRGEKMTKVEEFLNQKPRVINVGIEIFYEELKRLGVETIHVDWRPPGMGDESLLKILDEIRRG